MGKKLTMISVRIDDAEIENLDSLRRVLSPNASEPVSRSYTVRALIDLIDNKLLLARGNSQRKQRMTLYDKKEIA